MARPLPPCWLCVCLATYAWLGASTCCGDAISRLEAARTPQLEATIIGLARDAIKLHLAERRELQPPRALPEALAAAAGAFVSLGRNGRDRGCRGTLRPTQPHLALEIIRSAIAAATDDDRFAPVTAAEMADLDIFVSVVGELVPVDAPGQIDPATNGLAVMGPEGTGVLLPGEARTASWQWRECCRRAGVAAGARPQALRFRTTLFRSRTRR